MYTVFLFHRALHLKKIFIFSIGFASLGTRVSSECSKKCSAKQSYLICSWNVVVFLCVQWTSNHHGTFAFASERAVFSRCLHFLDVFRRVNFNTSLSWTRPRWTTRSQSIYCLFLGTQQITTITTTRSVSITSHTYTILFMLICLLLQH